MRGRWRITKLRSTRRLARRKGCWRPFPPYCGSLRWKGHRRAGFTDVDLTAVTEAISDAYRLDAEDADHQLVATIAEGVVVSGDQELLTQALANLVENALRHTPPGTHINVPSRAAPQPVRCCWSRMTDLPWRGPTCRA